MDQVMVPLPPEAPMAMPVQNLARPFRDAAAPGEAVQAAAVMVRVTVFAVVIVLTAVFGHEMVDILATGGLSVLEIVMAASFVTSFVWIALAAVTAASGAVMIALGLTPGRAHGGATPVSPTQVALIMPTYNEAPERVFGNAAAMMQALADHPTTHTYALFILSDTTDREIGFRELAALAMARATLGEDCALHYRRRDSNEGRKAGNIAEWCRRWGGGHDAFLVLDADSLMSAQAIVALTDALSVDPGAGLVQSVPRLINTETLFGRMQQFATRAYGPLIAAGQAVWSRGEGNYWGHNAIIRTRAFTASAGLPHLPGRQPFGGPVMSHDFVEAALLRRAGWRVTVLPQLAGSYEEAPPTLIDNVLRDRRWCQGNLQHLGVIGAAGLHPMSRFHLFQGVMAYLSSVLWMLFLVAGGAVAMSAGGLPIDYFPEAYTLFPEWPIIDWERAMTLLGLTAAVLLLPKLIGIALILGERGGLRRWGGAGRFIVSALTEIVMSAAIAPILMVQQTLAVARTVAGIDTGWRPQRRGAGAVRLAPLVRFHIAETVAGSALCLGMATGALPLWLAPIAVSLILAVPISAATSMPIPPAHRLWRLFGVPERLDPPPLLEAARAHGTAIGLKLALGLGGEGPVLMPFVVTGPSPAPAARSSIP